MTLLSRITGLVRETLQAVLFGAGMQMDAFEAAFRLPNILRRLFAEGAFSQAFVPILAEYQRRRGDDATRDLVGHVGGDPGAGPAGRDGAGRVGRARARLPARERLCGNARQDRTDRGPHPHRLPVHPVRVAGLAGRRRAQRLPALRRARVHAGAAQPVDHRRGDLPREVLRSADQGAGLGRVHRRRRAARVPAGAARAHRHAAAPAPRLARRGRAARAAQHGARA